jgi:two-component system, chemotaxis family, response regulator WspR
VSNSSAPNTAIGSKSVEQTKSHPIPAPEVRAVVLLVDDQPVMVKAIRKLLESCRDIEFHTCSDAAHAEEVAMEVLPTVILQELMMRGTDGLTLVKRYRANSALREVPVVMLSDLVAPETKANAFMSGANDYVVKLPSALELAARVRYHSQAYLASQQRHAAYRAVVEGQRAMRLRNIEIERQKALLEEQALMLEKANQELAESAFSDALTGLRNRRYFKTYIEAEFHDWEPEHASTNADSQSRRDFGDDLVLYIFDLDHFKSVNDTYGHDAGDVVLVEVAKRLRAAARAGDSLMRWGGEEFLVVSRRVRRDDGAEFAHRIMSAIADQPIVIPSGHQLRVTASIGWAPFPWNRTAPHAVSQEDVLFMADTAVYLSKRGGRNRAFGVVPLVTDAAVGPVWPAHVRKAGNQAPDQLAAEAENSVHLLMSEGPVAFANAG